MLRHLLAQELLRAFKAAHLYAGGWRLLFIRRCADLVPRRAKLVVASRRMGMRVRRGQGPTWAGVPLYFGYRLEGEHLRSSLARPVL